MKHWLSLFICFSFATAPIIPSYLNADEGSLEVAELVIEADPASPQPPPLDDQEAENVESKEEEAALPPQEKVKYVSKSSSENAPGKERVWVKFVVATAAVAVAIIALLLVKKDPGKR